MKSVLVAADTARGARLGLSVAADLYWGCGARVSLAYAPARAAVEPPAGIDAIGMLSDALFRDTGGAVATFRPAEKSAVPEALGDVLKDSPIPVDRYWEAGPGNRLDQICAHAERSGASLALVAGSEALCEGLVGGTSVPVWLLRESDERRHWFPLRRVLCAAKASRAVALSRGIAEQMGAELEVGAFKALLKGESQADMAVVERGFSFQLLRILNGTGRGPVIVV